MHEIYCSGESIVNFEQVNAGWGMILKTAIETSYRNNKC